MINDLNRVTLMGYVGADAKQQKESAPVVFSLATSVRWTDEQKQRQSRTEWHNVVVFGNLGKYAAKLKRGDRVYVEGQLRTSSYEKPAGDGTVTLSSTEIIAGQVERVAASGTESE